MGEIQKSLDKELDAAIFIVGKNVKYPQLRDEIESYYKGTLTKYTVWDFSDADEGGHFTAEEVQNLANQVKIHGKARRGCFDLIIVPELIKYGIGRMYSAYTDMTSEPDTLKTIVLRKAEDALAWIRQNEVQNRVNKPTR